MWHASISAAQVALHFEDGGLPQAAFMQPRAAYRTLVRQLKSRLGGAANARPWLEYVAEEFRGSAALSADESGSRLQLVMDYIYLLQSTHDHLVRVLAIS